MDSCTVNRGDLQVGRCRRRSVSNRHTATDARKATTILIPALHGDDVVDSWSQGVNVCRKSRGLNAKSVDEGAHGVSVVDEDCPFSNAIARIIPGNVNPSSSRGGQNASRC
jgi:hypothetical protein